MLWLPLRSPSQYRAHPGKQFRKRERLNQIIVSAELKSLYAIAHTVACGKKKNWRANLIAPEFCDDFPALLTWKHDIHDKEIKFRRTRLLQAAFAVARKINCETSFAESLREEGRCFLFVFDNENPHRRKCNLFWRANSSPPARKALQSLGRPAEM